MTRTRLFELANYHGWISRHNRPGWNIFRYHAAGTDAGTAIIITYNIRDFEQRDLAKLGWGVMTPLEFTTRYDLETD